ncbi:MAG: PRC-barrel domain-containing protein [Nitrospira sp.]
MVTSVLTPLIAILGWGIASLSFFVVIWVGSVPSTDNQMVKISRTTDMIGKFVKDKEGNILGRIYDRVFHWQGDSYTEYAVLSLEGVSTEKEAQVAVPWEALTLNTMQDYLLLDMNTINFPGDFRVVVYRFYDRSFAAVPGSGLSTTGSSEPASMDHIESVAMLWRQDQSAYRIP